MGLLAVPACCQRVNLRADPSNLEGQYVAQAKRAKVVEDRGVEPLTS